MALFTIKREDEVLSLNIRTVTSRLDAPVYEACAQTYPDVDCDAETVLLQFALDLASHRFAANANRN